MRSLFFIDIRVFEFHIILVDEAILNCLCQINICTDLSSKVKPVVNFQFIINFVLWSVEKVSGSLPAHLLLVYQIAIRSAGDQCMTSLGAGLVP